MKIEKVLTIIPSLYDGGAEKFTADLSLGLVNNNEITTLIYNSKQTTYMYGGVLHDLQIPESNGILKRLKRQLIIKNEIKKFKNCWSPKVSISHMLMANMLNIITKRDEKTICVLHGEWSIKTGKSKVLDLVVKHYYSKADIIVSVSKFIKNKFDNYYKLSVPHKVIYVGVDIPSVEKKSKNELSIDLPENYIVYVAGFRPVKNHILLLDELELYLKEQDVSLVLLGDGPLRKKIEREIFKRGLQEKVIVLGNLSNPYPIIKKAKVSLLYSSSESFSLAVVESMALGVPVVATDCGGPREIIVKETENNINLPFRNEFGILIEKPESNNHNTLISEIDLLLKNKTVWQNISVNGKIRAKDFSIEKAREDYNNLISKMITT